VRQRTITAAVVVPLLGIALAVGGAAIWLLIAAITALAAVEVFRLLRAAGLGSFPALGTALALVVVLDSATPGVFEGSGLLLGAIGIMLTAVAAFTRPDPHEGMSSWMGTIFGAIYVSLLSFVIRLGHAGPTPGADAPLGFLGGERGWILLLVLAVWSYDTGAYLVGSRFGKARFLSHISPSKTYAGLVGGAVATTAVVGALLWGLGQDPIHALALGPLTAFAAQAGDLAESLIKRAAGAKDSGTLVPGHGGILDRIDSFLFAAPMVTLYVVTVLA
jgi:phosphatidate cytidylyltransferase